jgi:hypothetical protein
MDFMGMIRIKQWTFIKYQLKESVLVLFAKWYTSIVIAKHT